MIAYDTTASATADGSGNATAIVQGPPWGQRWQLERITLSIPTMSTTAIVPCRVYRNSADAANTVGSTRTGQLDTDDQPRVALAPGEQLGVVWNSATPGAQCRVNVSYSLA